MPVTMARRPLTNSSIARAPRRISVRAGPVGAGVTDGAAEPFAKVVGVALLKGEGVGGPVKVEVGTIGDMIRGISVAPGTGVRASIIWPDGSTGTDRISVTPVTGRVT